MAQLCPTLCDPVGCSPPGFSVHGILQARTLVWVAMPFSRGSSPCGAREVRSPCAWRGGACHFYRAMEADSGFKPDSSVHGTSQAKILEWVAISFSRVSPCSGRAKSEPLDHQGSPETYVLMPHLPEGKIGLPRANPRGRLRSPS